MINGIKKHFDDFVFWARVMPALTAGFPVLAILVYKGILTNDWAKAGIKITLVIIVLSFFAYIIREWGKSCEEKLIKKLGGLPTTIILRFSDNKIDSVTKLRYHKWFNDNIKDIALPLSIEEEQKEHNIDDKYNSAINFLRTYANSNRDKFPRVYQELKKYNFWRNLYGGKRFFVLAYCLLVFREIIDVGFGNLKQMFMEPIHQNIVFWGLFVWTIVFCLIVTKKTVKRNAFDYAKTLLEIIDSML